MQVREHPRVGAERVTVGRLDLHHVGPEVGEDLAAPSRGDAAPELDDADVAQCLAHGRRTYGKLTSTSFHIRSPAMGRRADVSAFEVTRGSMELDLTPDQEFFADTTAKFLDDKATPSDLRALRHDPAGFTPGVLAPGRGARLDLAAGLGGGRRRQHQRRRACATWRWWPTSSGGTRHRVRCVPTNVVAAALSRRGSPSQKAEVLPGLLSGETIAAWCWGEPSPHDRLGEVTATASVTDDGYVLNGRKGPVEAGAHADHLLVVANTDEGPVQLLIPAATPGVTVVASEGLDLTRRFAEIEFDDVRVPGDAIVGDASTVADDLERQLQLANLIQLHEMVGVHGEGVRDHHGVVVRPVLVRTLARVVPGDQAPERRHEGVDRSRARHRRRRRASRAGRRPTARASTRARGRPTSVSTASTCCRTACRCTAASA